MTSFLFLVVIMIAQAAFSQTAWIADDFDDGLADGWKQVNGSWSVEDSYVRATSGQRSYLFNTKYIMRTKPYYIEARIGNGKGGVIFCLNDYTAPVMAHYAILEGHEMVTGYLSYNGEPIVTRRVSYLAPKDGFVTIKVEVDPVKRTYSVKVQNHELVLEALRYRSGYVGLTSLSSGFKCDFFQVVGTQPMDTPYDLVKTAQTQIDHLEYMTLLKDNIVISNPIVGIVQWLNSIGEYTLEIALQGQRSEPRGTAFLSDNSMLVVDGGENAIRMYNREAELERIFSGSLKDPRDIAVDEKDMIYVLDQEGVKVFDKFGKEQDGSSAKGLFKNARHMLYTAKGLYVSDERAAKVFLLDPQELSVLQELKEGFVHPAGMAFDEKTNDLYITDPGANVVIKYNKGGILEDYIDPVTINGFISPRCILVTDDRIIVGDYERILIFQKNSLTVRPSLEIVANNE
ncbi:MAG: hypothetical protein GXO82_09375 [Chlorobi bacterium]|nr:hypothetical protein [Chlorobiota bacterium]